MIDTDVVKWYELEIAALNKEIQVLRKELEQDQEEVMRKLLEKKESR
jgi:hypothetical protein